MKLLMLFATLAFLSSPSAFASGPFSCTGNDPSPLSLGVVLSEDTPERFGIVNLMTESQKGSPTEYAISSVQEEKKVLRLALTPARTAPQGALTLKELRIDESHPARSVLVLSNRELTVGCEAVEELSKP